MLQMTRFWSRVAYRFPIIARVTRVRPRQERRPPDGLLLCLPRHRTVAAAAASRTHRLVFLSRFLPSVPSAICHLQSATTCRAFYLGHQLPATSSQLIHICHILFDRKCLSPHDWHMQLAISTPDVAVDVASGADVQPR